MNNLILVYSEVLASFNFILWLLIQETDLHQPPQEFWDISRALPYMTCATCKNLKIHYNS